MPDHIRATSQEYPCCGMMARFTDDQVEIVVIQRKCPRCKIEWEIVRNKGVERNGYRLDHLEWRIVIEEGAA